MPARSSDPDTDGSFRRRALRRAGDWLARVSPLERASPIERTRPADPADEDGQLLSRDHDGRSYELFVPDSYDPAEPVPLVVLLHGCRQTAAGFAAETGMNAVAAAEGFLVAYPQQSRLANPLRCWRWYDDDQATRGNGELASIAGVTRAVVDAFAVDEDRIYVGGLSAGGAMAAQAIVEYPDLFAAAAVHSGLGYDAADGTISAIARMRTGRSNGRRQGRTIAGVMGPDGRPLPTLVVHGTADEVVDVENARRITEQVVSASRLGDAHGERSAVGHRPDGVATEDTDVALEPDDGDVALEPDDVDTGTTGPYDYTRRRFRDGADRLVVEEWLVAGMGHGWAGGAADGAYTAPEGPNASQLTWAFFEHHRRSALETPARVRIALPLLGTVDLPRPTRRRIRLRVERLRAALMRAIGR